MVLHVPPTQMIYRKRSTLNVAQAPVISEMMIEERCILLCPKLAEIKTSFFLFLNFYAINASFAVVFSLNELNDYHFVLISCYLRVLFKNSVQSSENPKPI